MKALSTIVIFTTSAAAVIRLVAVALTANSTSPTWAHTNTQLASLNYLAITSDRDTCAKTTTPCESTTATPGWTGT